MPWTAEVQLYPDGEDEDRVSATLIWDEGGPNEFRHTDKIGEISVPAGEAFLAAAVAARDLAGARRQKEINLTQQLENIANA